MHTFRLYLKLMKRQFPFFFAYCIILLILIMIVSKHSQEKTFDRYQQQKVRIAFFNEDEDSELIVGLRIYLSDYCHFVEVGIEDEEQKEALFYQEVDYIITIPHGFSKCFLKGEEVSVRRLAIPNSREAVYVDNAVNSYFTNAKLYIKINPSLSQKELLQLIYQSMYDHTEVVEVPTINVQNKNIYGSYFNILGYVLMACCILTIGNGMWLIQNQDMYWRNFVSPIPMRYMDLQLYLANATIVFLYTFIFLGIGYTLNDLQGINLQTLLYWINTVIFAISVLFFSYFVALLVKTRMSCNAISILVPLGVGFMSGVFIPQCMIGANVLRFASFFPVYWYVKANNIITEMSQNAIAPLVELRTVFLIEFLFAITFFLLSRIADRIRYR